jgi:hypothetical protein
MCGTGGCCGTSQSSIRRINQESVDLIRQKASANRADLLSNKKLRASILSSESVTAIEFLSLDKSDMRSVIVCQKMGNFGALDIKMPTLDIQFPGVLGSGPIDFG